MHTIQIHTSSTHALGVDYNKAWLETITLNPSGYSLFLADMSTYSFRVANGSSVGFMGAQRD